MSEEVRRIDPDDLDEEITEGWERLPDEEAYLRGVEVSRRVPEAPRAWDEDGSRDLAGYPWPEPAVAFWSGFLAFAC